MKIVVLDGYALNPGDLSWDEMRKLGDVTVYERTFDDKILLRISDAPIIFTNKTPITRETMEHCPNLEFIGVLATGFNVVDVSAAAELGITVCNVPSYSTDSVAQFVFALLLEICHHVGEHNYSVKAGDWSVSPDFCYWKHPLFELKGKTLGIIGYGRIGSAVADIARAFGMKILITGRTPKPGYVSIDELLSSSDIISLHCPLTAKTEGLIDSDTLGKCKDGVIIINTSRGGLINEKDMTEALMNGKVSCFAADVVSEEPIKDDNPLLMAPNTILTPHIAWAPLEARQRLMDTTVNNLKAYLDGNPQNVVSK